MSVYSPFYFFPRLEFRIIAPEEREATGIENVNFRKESRHGVEMGDTEGRDEGRWVLFSCLLLFSNLAVVFSCCSASWLFE